MNSQVSLDVTNTLDLIDAIGQIDEPAAIFSKLTDYFTRYGFTSFLISRLPSQRERLEPHILLNGWPTGWFERYTAVNHYRHDPCVRNCFSAIEPFTWDEMPAGLLEEPERQVVMREAAEFGLAEGFCIPLHDTYGPQAVVTMAGQHLDMTRGARRLLHLASLYAYGAAERASRKSTDHKGYDRRLTERERDVMHWSAEGKTFWEIAKILGISEATVNDHMRHIRVKLGTKNTTHSLAEALRRRELRL